MTLPAKRGRKRLTRLAAMLMMAVLGTLASHGQILDTNGLSLIWELKYGAAGSAPNADPDSDGVANRQESLAGTDPFSFQSLPKITAVAPQGATVSVSLPCALGKLYQLQSSSQLGNGSPTNWSTEASVVARVGTVVTLSAPASVASRFFRIAISDVDSDGDGLTDWEEYQLGLDPLAKTSNGQLDGNGQALSDYAFATNGLARQNRISLSAPDPVANQPDSGQSAINLGGIQVTRGGFPLNGVTVNLALAGPGAGLATEGLDFAPLPRSVYLAPGVSSQLIPLTPLANTNRMTPAVATLRLLSGAGYAVDVSSNASVTIYPSQTPSGTGLTGQYFTNSSTTYSSSANFNPTNLFLTRLDPTVDFVWGPGTSPNLSNGAYTVRWTGQVQPQYSETYYFVANTDDGVILWVNDQLVVSNWTAHSAADSVGTIDLQGDVRYNLRLEYFNRSGAAVAHLYWYSASQPKQIIPSSRLYPSSVPAAPATVTSPLTAVAFLGQPFSYQVTAANTPLGYSAAPLPPGLSFNASSGLLSGTPLLAGTFQLQIGATNALGGGTAALTVQVLDTGSAVTREVWTGIPGTNVGDIPVDSPPTSLSSYGGLEGITDYGDNYGERIRGYLTAPVTGNYYFWLAGSDAAELWISNDSEPVNQVRRAYVLAPGTASRQWNLQPNQRSPWLSLVAGQRYYFEVLHKAGTGTGDNWAVAWLQDPTGTNTTPSSVVPSYVLSRYLAPPPALQPGTLYAANMLAQAGVASTAVGSATLRLNADGTQAVLKFSYSGLTSPLTGEHIHADAYLTHSSQIVFDIDAATPQPDGSYVWNIAPVGTLSAADIVEIIREGKAYINIHTVNYPNGEINGHFALADGVQTFVPPPAPLAWTDDHADTNAAARFLIQATFGPSTADIAAVQSLGYAGWISNQFSLPPTYHLSNVLAQASADPSKPYPGSLTFNTWWMNSITAPDQLRQRTAFALSEIMVVSQTGVLQDNARALSAYYDTLLANAFGNFRDLLQAVTLTPAMGLYLDMRGNDKGSLVTGLHANENYGREIMQLFSIGLYRLWPDGSLVLDSQGNLVPTYDQNVIMGFASVFTGWNYHQANQSNGRLPTNWYPPSDYIDPMVLVPTHHELGTKRLLDNVILPPAWGTQTNSASTDFDTYGSQDLQQALDSIFYHPNVGPFICRQLIQRLVTSQPSREYLYRVVQKFNDNGAGVRGDMQAVLLAILLDYEARSPVLLGTTTYGKQREPVLRVTAPARAFPAPPTVSGTYSQSGTAKITVTTTTPHDLGSGDTVFLNLTDTSGQPVPPSQGYSVTVTGPSSFTCNAPGIASGSYTLTPNLTISNMVTQTIVTTNILMVNISGHGLTPGSWVYLNFTSGGALSGSNLVIWNTNNNYFAVATSDSVARSGSCLIPKLTGGGYVQTKTNVTVSTAYEHGLNPGDQVFLNFNAAGSTTDGVYTVSTVADTTHFSVGATAPGGQTQNNLTTYPLVPPHLNRAGNVVVQWSTWNVGFTDNGAASSLYQTPLNSPTVFNFFYPDYKFPGALASAGLTTPEFQLTSDSSVASQMNYLEGGLLNNANNTNGPSSFAGGNGAIVLDLSPWMSTNYTDNVKLAGLVDSLNTLLCAGQLAPQAKATILNYVTNTANFSYSTPPTQTQMRDRVRAVVHLILTSPDFTIQK